MPRDLIDELQETEEGVGRVNQTLTQLDAFLQNLQRDYNFNDALRDVRRDFGRFGEAGDQRWFADLGLPLYGDFGASTYRQASQLANSVENSQTWLAAIDTVDDVTVTGNVEALAQSLQTIIESIQDFQLTEGSTTANDVARYLTALQDYSRIARDFDPEAPLPTGRPSPRAQLFDYFPDRRDEIDARLQEIGAQERAIAPNVNEEILNFDRGARTFIGQEITRLNNEISDVNELLGQGGEDVDEYRRQLVDLNIELVRYEQVLETINNVPAPLEPEGLSLVQRVEASTREIENLNTVYSDTIRLFSQAADLTSLEEIGSLSTQLALDIDGVTSALREQATELRQTLRIGPDDPIPEEGQGLGSRDRNRRIRQLREIESEIESPGIQAAQLVERYLDINTALIDARQRVQDQAAQLEVAQAQADQRLLVAQSREIQRQGEERLVALREAEDELTRALRAEAETFAGAVDVQRQIFDDVVPRGRDIEQVITDLESSNREVIRALEAQRDQAIRAAPDDEALITERYSQQIAEQEQTLSDRIQTLRDGDVQSERNALQDRLDARVRYYRDVNDLELLRVAIVAASENRITEIRRNEELTAQQINERIAEERANTEGEITRITQRETDIRIREATREADVAFQQSLRAIQQREQAQRQITQSELGLATDEQQRIIDQARNRGAGFFGQNIGRNFQEERDALIELRDLRIAALNPDLPPDAGLAEVRRIYADTNAQIQELGENTLRIFPDIGSQITSLTQRYASEFIGQTLLGPGQLEQQLDNLDRQTQNRIDQVNQRETLNEAQKEERITQIKFRAEQQRTEIEIRANQQRSAAFDQIGVQFVQSLANQLIEWTAFQASKLIIAQTTDAAIAASGAAGGAGAGLLSAGAGILGSTGLVAPLLAVGGAALLYNEFSDGRLFHDPISDRRARNVGAEIRREVQAQVQQNNRESASDFLDNVSAGARPTTVTAQDGGRPVNININIDTPIEMNKREFAKILYNEIIELENDNEVVRRRN